jgi:hypothetical protein
VEEGPEGSDWCFDPRHILGVFAGGKKVDLVVCFECHAMHVHEDDGEGYRHYTISEAARPVLDGILTGAGIPLAKQ